MTNPLSHSTGPRQLGLLVRRLNALLVLIAAVAGCVTNAGYMPVSVDWKPAPEAASKDRQEEIIRQTCVDQWKTECLYLLLHANAQQILSFHCLPAPSDETSVLSCPKSQEERRQIGLDVCMSNPGQGVCLNECVADPRHPWCDDCSESSGGSMQTARLFGDRGPVTVRWACNPGAP